MFRESPCIRLTQIKRDSAVCASLRAITPMIATGKRNPKTKQKRATALPKATLAMGKSNLAAGAEHEEGPIPVSAEARRNLIAIAAYLRAEQRGFRGGSPEHDWLEAEAEADRALAGRA